MKRIWLFRAVLFIALVIHASAFQAREVVRPCFVTSTTESFEITKIAFNDEQTRVDAVFYGNPGDLAIISSSTMLRAGENVLPLTEAEHLSIDGLTMPESVPQSGKMNVALFFSPLPSGIHSVDLIDPYAKWGIYGVQLTSAEPYVFLPEFLKVAPDKMPDEKENIPDELVAGKGVINGYVLGYDRNYPLDVRLQTFDPLTNKISEQTVQCRADGAFHVEADLLANTQARLCLNKYSFDFILIPKQETAIYIHLPRASMSVSRLFKTKYIHSRKVWFDGAAAVYNNSNVDRKRDALQPSSLLKPIASDLGRARMVLQNVQKNIRIQDSDKKLMASVSSPEVLSYLKSRITTALAEGEKAKSAHGYMVLELDSTVMGKDILSAVVAPYKGSVVFVDLWATWCGPCRKALRLMPILKQRLAKLDVVYVYITCPSSPETEWRTLLPAISGIHYRLTEEQWNSLCNAYQIKGIPGYLIIDANGKLQNTHVGFPGLQTLLTELQQAGH